MKYKARVAIEYVLTLKRELTERSAFIAKVLRYLVWYFGVSGKILLLEIDNIKELYTRMVLQAIQSDI